MARKNKKENPIIEKQPEQPDQPEKKEEAEVKKADPETEEAEVKKADSETEDAESDDQGETEEINTAKKEKKITFAKIGEKIEDAYEMPFWKWFVLCFVIAFVMEFVLEILGRRSISAAFLFLLKSPWVFLYNIMIVYFTLLLALLVRKRVFMLGFMITLWMVCGITNFVVLGYRITPFSAIDFLMISDALSMLDIYFNMFQQILLFGGIITGVILLVIIFIKTPKMKGKINRLWNILACLIVFVIIYAMTIVGVKTDLLSNNFSNLGTAYKNYGFAYCFANSIVDTGISKPEEYGKELVDTNYEAVKDKKEEGPKRDPDIIIIQLESFIDIGRVKGIHTDIDSIPNFHAMMEKYPSGYLTVPAIGAGTANTEFELLTGMRSKAFGAGEYPYKTVLTHTPCESMAQTLHKAGYKTHAIHNNKSKFYSRDESYPNLGFDTFTSVEYMENVTYTLTGWAKDDCLIEEIFKALDSTEERDLVFAVSVQGHGKYPTEELKCEEHVKVTLDSGDPELTNQFGYFVNQCYEMDAMCQRLKEQLDERGTPYILVLYGDHIPALTFEEDQFEKGTDEQTEYVIVNNIGISLEDQDVGTYEISDMILSQIGKEKGVMQKTRATYAGDEENFYATSKLFQYDMLYGDHYLYEEIEPYQTSEMKMGVSEIRITDMIWQPGRKVEVTTEVMVEGSTERRVEEKDDEGEKGILVVKGEHFTPFSVLIRGEDDRMDTVYMDSETLLINFKEEPESGEQFAVAQISKDKHELSRSEIFLKP